MGWVLPSIRAVKRLFTVHSTTVISKAKANYTLIVEIITSESSKVIRKRVEDFTNGREKMPISMKVNLREANATEGVFFGGAMEVATRATSRMVCSLVGVFCTV